MAQDLANIEATEENYQKYFPTDYIGPSWQRDEEGDFLLPERTIGWHCLAWIRENLIHFDGEGPFQLTPEQTRLILWWYALDEDMQFSYRTWVMVRVKGHGKSPLAAVLCLLELVGPSQFSHYDKEHNLYIGKRHPNANIGLAAVSKDQTSSIRDLFQVIVPQRTREKYHMDIQREIIYADKGAVLRTYGTSPKSLQGIRFTFVTMDECHEFTESNHANKAYRTVMDNLAKTGGRIFLPTNAYMPGEDSIAEQLRLQEERVWAGRAESSGVMYDSIEAHPSIPMSPDWMQVALPHLRGDAIWLTWDRIKSSFLSGATPNSLKARMWQNRSVVSEESVFTPADIRNATDDDMLGTINDLKLGDEITLGFDGGKTDDATALVAFRLRDKAVIPIAVWEKPDHIENWHIDQTRVDSAVNFAFSRFDVKAFYADVALWESYIDKWSEAYGDQLEVKATGHSAIAFDMRGNTKKIASNNEFFVGNVREQGIVLNGAPVLREHMLNVEARYGRDGLLKFGKKGGAESTRKIDCLISATLAYMAYRDLMEKRSSSPKKVQYRRSHLITG